LLGVKLNKIKANRKKDSKKRKNLENGIHNTMMSINCVVGGVPVRLEKINTKKKITKVKGYTDKCDLDFSKKRYRTNDIMFRKKFVVLCTSKMLRNEKKIFNKVSKPYRNLKNYEKFRIIKDHEIFCVYMNFVMDVIGKYDTVSDSLFDMYYLLNDKDISKKLSIYRKKIDNNVNNSYKKIFGKKSYKMLSNIFNMTAILATGNGKLDSFSYKDFKGYTPNDDLEKQIRKLGRRIIKNKISSMFDTYIQCNPKISTMYVKEVNENDYDVIIGLLALSYTDYMFNNYNLHYVVRTLLRRPWDGSETKK
jgi:hypothetical protein